MIVQTPDDVALIVAAVRDGVSVGKAVTPAELEGLTPGFTPVSGSLARLEAALLETLKERGSLDVEVKRTAAGVILHFYGAP